MYLSASRNSQLTATSCQHFIQQTAFAVVEKYSLQRRIHFLYNVNLFAMVLVIKELDAQILVL